MAESYPRVISPPLADVCGRVCHGDAPTAASAKFFVSSRPPDPARWLPPLSAGRLTLSARGVAHLRGRDPRIDLSGRDSPAQTRGSSPARPRGRAVPPLG